jgi:phenylacetate-CoA ligase
MSGQYIPQKVDFSPAYCASSLKTLETALEKVPMYRSWQALDPGPGHSIDERFAAMPALTKNDIRQNFPGGVLPEGLDLNRAVSAGEISLVETSGSTDDKVTNIWNQQWWDASEAASWKLNSRMYPIATGYHREAILVNPRNVGIVSDEVDLSMEQRRLARFLYLNEKTDPTAWSSGHMDRMVQEINTFQPVILEVNPSYLARLCRYIDAHRRPVFQPGAIVFTYEFPTRLYHSQIRRCFPGVPVISSYGTTETGYVFMQCEEGKWHQNSEFCRVDFQPRKAEHGGPLLGRILVTPLNNPWCYFIHFDTGDIVKLEESGRCPCGRGSGLILSAVAGRKTNLTLTCSGRLVTLLELDNVVSRLGGIEMYKLNQTDLGVYELYLVSRRSDLEKLDKAAVSELKGLYGPQARVNVSHVHDIAPEGSGKYLVSGTSFRIELDSYLDKK